jgi:hypothetical protein
MKTDHYNINSDGERGRVHDREWREENQQLDHEIEHIKY